MRRENLRSDIVRQPVRTYIVQLLTINDRSEAMQFHNEVRATSTADAVRIVQQAAKMVGHKVVSISAEQMRGESCTALK